MLPIATKVRDPIHGMIEVNEGELALISDPVFQRLRNIRQLAMTYKVYPGATHSRFEHSLGVMHVASRIMDQLYKQVPVNGYFDKEEYKRLRQLIRLAALLHDIGHGPFSHGGEEVFEKGVKHEDFSIAIIKKYFAETIQKYFPTISINEITGLLQQKHLGAKLVFLNNIISGEMDADKLDYLARDSYYCGVKYGQYDLERLLDTFTIVSVTDGSEEDNMDGAWQLGIDSDGVHAAEALIFARYWMFIQVYFHKTRRIYDYYLTQFLKSTDIFHPKLEELDKYISIDDNTILEQIKKESCENEWAKRIYNREHLSEAYVSTPHHTGLESYLIFKELKEDFKRKFNDPKGFLTHIDDHAQKLPTNPLFDLVKKEDDDDDDEAINQKQFMSILLQDKHDKSKKSIFDVSLPLSLLSKKSINIVRFYVDKGKVQEANKWCTENYEAIRNKIEKLKRGWS